VLAKGVQGDVLLLPTHPIYGIDGASNNNTMHHKQLKINQKIAQYFSWWGNKKNWGMGHHTETHDLTFAIFFAAPRLCSLSRNMRGLYYLPHIGSQWGIN